MESRVCGTSSLFGDVEARSAGVTWTGNKFWGIESVRAPSAGKTRPSKSDSRRSEMAGKGGYENRSAASLEGSGTKKT